MEIKLDIEDLKGLFRRRKKSFFFPFLLIFLAAAVVAFKLPPVYQSEATILVEGQKISDDYVTNTMDSFVEERIETITRQIMSRAKLMEIINQLNLYTEMREKATAKDLADKLREDIALEMIDADMHDRKSGREIIATIAFTLSYQGKNPAMVKNVTNLLASLYVEEDLKERGRYAVSTTEFFQVELEGLRKKIVTYEKEISDFKRAHLEEMPEYNAINIQAVSQLERELDRMRARIQSLQQEKTKLKARLTGVNPFITTVVNSNNMLLNPKDRLKQLRVQLMTLQSTLSDEHPDVKRLKRAIKELETVENISDDSTLKLQRLKEIENQLKVLKGKLGPKHPDVLKLSQEARQIELDLKARSSEKQNAGSSGQKPDNPAYLNLQVQIIGVETELQTLFQEQRKVRNEIEAYRRKIRNAPLVEKEYSELTRDYESARQRYGEISDKLMEVKFAQEMDESQRATRFRILEPAYLPQKPIKPNRKAIGILGFFMACISGFAFAVFRESTDTSIKTKDELDSLTGIPVFAVIPYVESRSTSRVRKLIWSCAILLIFFVSLWLIHRYISPIDILWIEYGSSVIERFR